MEQRIVNPDGFRTNLGKRDIRAVPGPLTPAPKAGTSSYSSMLEIPTPTTFTPPTSSATRPSRRSRRTAAVSACCSGSRSTPRPTGRASPSPRPARSAAPASAAAPPDRPRRRPGRFRLGIRSADKASAKVNWTPATAAPGATRSPATASRRSPPSPNAANEQARSSASARTPRPPASRWRAGPGRRPTTSRSAPSPARLSAPFTATTAGTPTGGTPKDTRHPDQLTVTPAAVTEATPPRPLGHGHQPPTAPDLLHRRRQPGGRRRRPLEHRQALHRPDRDHPGDQLHFVAFDTAATSDQSPDDGFYAPDASPAGFCAPTGLKATDGQGQGHAELGRGDQCHGLPGRRLPADGTTRSPRSRRRTPARRRSSPGSPQVTTSSR